MKLVEINLSYCVLLSYILYTADCNNNLFFYAPYLVEFIQEKSESEVRKLQKTTLQSYVCSDDDSDRLKRCQEAVRIDHCQYKNIKLVGKEAGKPRVYGIRQIGPYEEPIIACECPTEPVTIYLSDAQGYSVGQVNVIFETQPLVKKNQYHRYKDTATGKINALRVRFPVKNKGRNKSTTDENKNVFADKISKNERSSRSATDDGWNVFADQIDEDRRMSGSSTGGESLTDCASYSSDESTDIFLGGYPPIVGGLRNRSRLENDRNEKGKSVFESTLSRSNFANGRVYKDVPIFDNDSSEFASQSKLSRQLSRSKSNRAVSASNGELDTGSQSSSGSSNIKNKSAIRKNVKENLKKKTDESCSIS